MSALSDFGELKVLDHMLGTAAWTYPSQAYIGLSTGSMADDNSGTELSGNGYTRMAINFAAASSGSAASNATVTFPTATGAQGAISHWAIYDASTSCNQICHGSFSTTNTIGSGDILRINSGDITITAA